MKKIYAGDPDDRCPDMGGKLCSKACPTCKAYQEFSRELDGVRTTFWDCAKYMLASLQIEGNAIAAAINHRLVGNQAAIESLRNETAKAQAAAKNVIGTQVEMIRQLAAVTTGASKPLMLVSDTGGNGFAQIADNSSEVVQ